MIWFTLALFVISFLVTAFLTSKPDLEDARANTLKDVSFPRATENAPIPLILGKVRMDAPNTTWYGDFQTIPIIEKIKTGLFSSTKVIVGYRYFLGLDLALGMGPRIQLTEIYMDDKLAWSGTTSATAPTQINIDEPNFWGGYKEGGGWIGTARYYPGSLDILEQPVNAYLEGQVGAGQVPAYLGTAHIVMEGCEIGESAQLRKMAFVMEGYTNALGITGNGKIGEDMNPAEAIYQIMTHSWRGMSVSPADIDTAALAAIGEVLYIEGNGVSVVVTSETTGRNLIQEILRQIDGISYQDPDTGKIVFKLIRDDYVVDDLDTYDEADILKITNFSRTGWDEVVAQVKVTFPQRNKESEAVAISQDMATVNMIGRLRSTTISMPFLYDKSLANNIASRERAQLSVPLFRITIEFNRNANTLRPGSVFKLNWTEYGFSGLVLRVQEFDFGELAKGRIVAKCLQDQFALDNTVFSAPADSGWVAPVVTPTNILVKEIVEMPRYFQNRLAFPLPDGNAGVAPLPVRPSTASSGFDMVAGDVSGDLDVREPAEVPYPATGTLVSQYDDTIGFLGGVDAIGFTITNVIGTFEAAGSLAEAKEGEVGLLYCDGEYMTFEGVVDNGNGTWTLSNINRGVLGSRPKTHAATTRLYQISPELWGTGILDDLLLNGTIYYKLLDRVGPTSQADSQVIESSQAMTDVANRPLRPRNLQINGSRALPVVITDHTDRSLSWVRSNREASLIAMETEADEIPDISNHSGAYSQEVYDVEVYINGALNGTLSADNQTSPYTLPFSSTVVTGDGEIRVYAKWADDPVTIGKESLDYAFFPFTIDQSFTALTITNAGAENGDISGWTISSGTPTVRTANPAPNTGTYYFTGGNTASSGMYQDVSVPSGEYTNVDAGTALTKVTWWQNSFAGSDQANISLEFFDGSMVSLGTSPGPGLAAPTSWTKRDTSLVSIPVNTRTIRIIISWQRFAGTNSDGYIDDISGLIT